MKLIRFLSLIIALFFFVGLRGQDDNSRSSIRLTTTDTAHFYMKHSYDVLKYNLFIDLYNCYQSPYSTYFSANELITFKVDSVLSSIRLNAVNSSIQIDSVGLAGISFSHVADSLIIRLNQTYQLGNIVSVKVFYKHKNTADHALFSSEGFVFTDSPPENARKWLPCWDRPSDKALLELTAKVPSKVKFGSNGSLADSLIKGDTIFYHWVSKDPMATYLMTMTSMIGFSLDIVYWHKLYHPSDSIPVRFYFQKGQHPDSIEHIIGSMTDFFSSLFGEYPFEKIGFATLNGSFPWGGMENQTMINLTTNGWHEGLVAHEFSHHWFGDLVTCGTWADIWLNESFASYCESLWLEHRVGESGYRNHLDQQADYYLAKNPGFAIYNPLWAIQTPDVNLLYNSAVIYDKGACVLHQLRYVMGDSSFFKLLKDYVTDSNLTFKNAVTDDFISRANKINGTSLDWFFNEWLFHPNHPVYSNSYEIQKYSESNWMLKLRIFQKQTNTVYFKMPVQLKVVFSDSSENILNVMNDKIDQFYQFVFTKQPIYLVFDPYRNILLKSESTIPGTEPF